MATNDIQSKRITKTDLNQLAQTQYGDKAYCEYIRSGQRGWYLYTGHEPLFLGINITEAFHSLQTQNFLSPPDSSSTSDQLYTLFYNYETMECFHGTAREIAKEIQILLRKGYLYDDMMLFPYEVDDFGEENSVNIANVLTIKEYEAITGCSPKIIPLHHDKLSTI